jgi:two-component system LytT family response regulator
MRALIIDDERLARKELTNLLQEYPEIEIVGEAVNAEDAEEKIQALQPDLLFLDIQMPGKTGFELLETLDSVPDVVFTTAYDEYAMKAFDFNALDYLLKPIEPNRLKETITKLINRPKKEAVAEIVSDQKLGPQDRVFVKDGDKCWFVKLENIRLFESDGNYIKIYFDNFKPMIINH